MKRGFYIAAAVILAALAANLLLADPGYVALRLAGRLIEMSLVTFAVLLIAGYFLIRLLARALRARQLWREAQIERRRDRGRKSLSQGVLELAAGEWENAEAIASRYARDAQWPAANYLLAARAAELLGAAKRRDEWLARALESSPESRVPALIMQAELHLKHKQLQSAQAILEELQAHGPQNARGLMLLARVYRQTGNWQQLQALEPRLRSTRGISTSVADETVAQIYLDRLKAASSAPDIEELRTAWKELPKSLTTHSDIVVAYARSAMAHGADDAAEACLREFIDEHWDEAAVLTYGELQTGEPLQTLERAERWLAAHGEDSALLLTCARLSARAELYGKARSYLETSIAIRPRLEAYQLLAALMEQLGEREQAVRALNDALTLAVGRRASLPSIRARRWVDRRQNERRRS